MVLEMKARLSLEGFIMHWQIIKSRCGGELKWDNPVDLALKRKDWMISELAVRMFLYQQSLMTCTEQEPIVGLFIGSGS